MFGFGGGLIFRLRLPARARPDWLRHIFAILDGNFLGGRNVTEDVCPSPVEAEERLRPKAR